MFSNVSLIEKLLLLDIAPAVEFIKFVVPTITNVVTVVHVWNENVFDSSVRLSLRVLHGESRANNNKSDTRCSGHNPLVVYKFYVSQMYAVCGSLILKNNDCVFGVGGKGFFVIKWVWWYNKTNDN